MSNIKIGRDNISTTYFLTQIIKKIKYKTKLWLKMNLNEPINNLKFTKKQQNLKLLFDKNKKMII